MKNYITTKSLRLQKARNTLDTLLAINKPRKIYQLVDGKRVYLGETEETLEYTLLRQLDSYLTEVLDK